MNRINNRTIDITRILVFIFINLSVGQICYGQENDRKLGILYWNRGEYEKAAARFEKLSVYSLNDAFLLKDCSWDWKAHSNLDNPEAELAEYTADFNIDIIVNDRKMTADDIIALIEFGNTLLKMALKKILNMHTIVSVRQHILITQASHNIY